MEDISSMWNILYILIGLAVAALLYKMYTSMDGFDSDPLAGTTPCDPNCSNGYSKITAAPCCKPTGTSAETPTVKPPTVKPPTVTPDVLKTPGVINYPDWMSSSVGPGTGLASGTALGSGSSLAPVSGSNTLPSVATAGTSSPGTSSPGTSSPTTKAKNDTLNARQLDTPSMSSYRSSATSGYDSSCNKYKSCTAPQDDDDCEGFASAL
jgi:hypothetical protein